jgi:hypothetical protein
MNRTLTALKAQAAKAAYDRGHRMFWTLDTNGQHHVLEGVCRDCACAVRCDPRPHTGTRFIEGAAVSSRCDRSRAVAVA